MEKNYSNYSKNTLEKEKQLHKAAGDYIASYEKNLKESLEAKEAEKMNQALSSARFGYASTYTRSKNRVNSLMEEIRYQNTSTTVAMTEMVTQIVCEALLLDESEFAKLNPNYKSEIKETVRGFLENANINENISNSETIKIMEYVAKKLPSTKEGKYLTEDNIEQLMRMETPAEVEASIKHLSGNIASRVASLVEKEQEKIEKIQKDLDKVAPNSKADPDKEAQDAGEQKPDEDEAEETKDDTTKDDAAKAEDTAVEDKDIEAAVDEAPAEDVAVDTAAEDGDLGKTEKAIEIKPDGTLKIRVIDENVLVRETPRNGLIESLAVNEAQNMIAEGKEYNPDLAIANAIMYVTITEAMDELGLVNVNEDTYSQIITSAGGCLNLNDNKTFNKNKMISESQKVTREWTKKDGTEQKKDYVYYTDKVDPRRQQKRSVYDGKDHKNNGSSMRDYGELKPEHDLTKKSGNLSETVFAAQSLPLNTYSPDDLSERIRRKRLEEEAKKKSNNLD